MSMDTRAEAGRVLGIFDRRAWRAVVKTLLCGLAGLVLALGPGGEGWGARAGPGRKG